MASTNATHFLQILSSFLRTYLGLFVRNHMCNSIWTCKAIWYTWVRSDEWFHSTWHTN